MYKRQIASPVLKTSEYEKIKQLNQNGQKAVLQSILYDYVPENGVALQQALEALFKETEQKIDAGATIIILSDREVIQAQEGKVAIPILLAVSGLHNYLVRKGKRSLASIVADTAEVCEVHHYAMLVGYGASGVHPYGAYQTLAHFELSEKIESYRKACEKGMSKSCHEWESQRSPVTTGHNCLKRLVSLRKSSLNILPARLPVSVVSR